MINSGREKFANYMATQQVIEYDEGAKTAERIWSRSWLPELYEENKKYLLILGDAVTEGMSYYYEEFMGEEWSVHRLTGSLPTTDELFDYRLSFALTAARKNYNAVVFTPTIRGDEKTEEFKSALEKVIRRIKEQQPNAKLIIAENTFVNPLIRSKNENINIYGFNKTAELMAAEYGVKFTHLGEFSGKITGDHTADGVLFTDAGYKKLAFEAVKQIK